MSPTSGNEGRRTVTIVSLGDASESSDLPASKNAVSPNKSIQYSRERAGAGARAPIF